MRKVILVHGWGGNASDEAWFGWLRNQLEKKGFKVEAWDMPNTNYPRIGEWVNFLKEKVPKPDADTYFVGHSIGCQTILRYLESLEEGIKVGGCVFVAGWFNLIEETYEDPEDKEIAKPWIENPINFEKVKDHTDTFVAIFSDNDPDVPLSDKDLFEQKLGAKIIIEHNKGHFSDDVGVKELPVVLKEILQMI